MPFAGVHIVEATKQVYRAIPARRERTQLIPSLRPVLVPSSTATRKSTHTEALNFTLPVAGLSHMRGNGFVRAVMAGLVPAIHVFLRLETKTWMPGTSPGMTSLWSDRAHMR
jgi:hypothetical protein